MFFVPGTRSLRTSQQDLQARGAAPLGGARHRATIALSLASLSTLATVRPFLRTYI